MARHKSAEKELCRSLKRREVNRRNKSTLRTRIKELRKAIENKDIEEAQKLLPKTISLIDETVKKGTIHPRTGDRYKSRLTRQVVLLSQPNPK
ncbi:MAG: 30S ribosomal protein S20 [Candidatus Aminicenantia bacterium]